MREQLGPGLGVPGQCQATGAGPMTQWICPGSSVSGEFEIESFPRTYTLTATITLFHGAGAIPASSTPSL